MLPAVQFGSVRIVIDASNDGNDFDEPHVKMICCIVICIPVVVYVFMTLQAQMMMEFGQSPQGWCSRFK